MQGPVTGYHRTCHDCPVDTDCTKVGCTLANLPINRGHYRFSAHTDRILECPGLGHCKKGKSCACAGSSGYIGDGAVNATSTTTIAVTAVGWRIKLEQS
jgi:hypothetical protein